MESFFPEPVRPVVKALFARLCKYWPAGATADPDAAGAEKLPPLNTDSVAERRRARALKALDRKLAEMEAEPDVPLDEETGKS